MSPIYGSCFYLTQLSISSFIVTIFTFTFSLFFLIGRKRTRATKDMGIAYALLTLFHFAYFFGFSFFHPWAAYHRWFTVFFVLLTQTHIILFVIRYPDNRNHRFSLLINGFLYTVTILITAVYIYKTSGLSPFYSFDGHYWDFRDNDASIITGYTIVAYSIISIIIAVWRITQLKSRELFSILLIIVPLFAGMIAPAIFNVMTRKGLMTREVFQISLNLSHLICFFIMSLIYLNTTKDKFTLLGKIVGVSILTFLALFLLITRLNSDHLDEGYDRMKMHQLQLGLAGLTEKPEYIYLMSFSSSLNKYKFIYAAPGFKLDPGMKFESLKNLDLLDKISRLPDNDFEENYKIQIEERYQDIQYAGYIKLIKSLLYSITPEQRNKGQFLAAKINEYKHFINFNYNNISTMSEADLKQHLKIYIENSSELFLPFKSAIMKVLEDPGTDLNNLKKNILSMIEPMTLPGTKLFRTSAESGFLISYQIKDSKTELLYESGFSYIQYREYLHKNEKTIIIFIIGVMIFMIIGYPWLYFGSLYIPLKQLVNGVNEVQGGNLNYRLQIKSEDEIGFLTDRFNVMVDALSESRNAILNSEKKYRELADLLPDIIYEADIDLNITYFNKAGFFLTGYNESDILSGLSLKKIIDKTDIYQIEKYISKYDIENPHIFSRNHNVLKKDAGTFIGANRAVLILTETRPAVLRGIIRDITEQKKTDDALIQIQKMDTIGTLTSGIAHDFNNIFSGITGPISLMKLILDDPAPDFNEIKSLLETMDHSSSRAVDMIKQLLALSHKTHTEFLPFDLSSSVRNVYKICTSTFDKSISIILDIPPGDIMVEGDQTQIEQSILNICINASHAMTIMRCKNEIPGGKLNISIDRIKADQSFVIAHPNSSEKCYWKISISDTGIGMDSHIISKIFMPFFTTKEKGSGTGLGLSMVYNIIRYHRGFIDVYSETGKGSIFHIYLPVLKEHHSIINESETDIPRGTGTILIVDDEETLRHTAGLILKKCGYNTITAEDGAAALEIISNSNQKIDLILLDLMMPGLSGEQILDELDKMAGNYKILLTSGLSDEERINRLIDQGKYSFIQKPYTIEKLARTVQQLLN